MFVLCDILQYKLLGREEERPSSIGLGSVSKLWPVYSSKFGSSSVEKRQEL